MNHLHLVTDDTPPPLPAPAREPEELLLRPFWVFRHVATVSPLVVRLGARKRAGKRCKAPAPAPVEVADPQMDLLAYRPRVRARALRAYAPRVQRPGARPRSLGLLPLSPAEKAQLIRDEAELRAAGVLARPAGEGNADCANISSSAPCPWAGCRMHLGKEVDELTGALKQTFPDREVWEIPETCTFRAVRDRGALSLNEVGKLINVTEEWVRQIEGSALRKGRRWAKGRRA